MSTREEQVAAIVRALFPVAELRDFIFTTSREQLNDIAAEVLNQLAARQVWSDSIPADVPAVYTQNGILWHREYTSGKAGKREGLDYWAPTPLSGPELIRTFGPVSNTPPDETTRSTEEMVEAGTTVIDGINKAYRALTGVNNGKRNRLLCQAAESALHRAMAALQKMAPDGD